MAISSVKSFLDMLIFRSTETLLKLLLLRKKALEILFTRLILKETTRIHDLVLSISLANLAQLEENMA